MAAMQREVRDIQKIATASLDAAREKLKDVRTHASVEEIREDFADVAADLRRLADRMATQASWL